MTVADRTWLRDNLGADYEPPKETLKPLHPSSGRTPRQTSRCSGRSSTSILKAAKVRAWQRRFHLRASHSSTSWTSTGRPALRRSPPRSPQGLHFRQQTC